jgi:hypothetical protein
MRLNSFGMMVWSVVLGKTQPFNDMTRIITIARLIDPEFIPDDVEMSARSEDELIEGVQGLEEFPMIAFAYTAFSVNLKEREEETIGMIFETTLVPPERRDLDSAYAALLRHPWRQALCRASVQNPSGLKNMVFGVGPRLDGLPPDHPPPTENE